MRGEQYRFGPFCLDVGERELRRDGELVALTAKTFDLLLLLVEGAGRTFQKSELLEALWPDSVVEENNLSQTVFLLRKALGENGDGSDYVLTVPRRGYKFVGRVSPQQGAENGSAASHATPVPHTSRVWPAIAVFAILALAAIAFVHFRQVGPAAPVVRSTILPPEKTSFAFTTNFGVMALSPDGRRMVFAATREDGKTQLWIRPLDAVASRALDGTEGARFPFWAPDSRWLGFFADGKLKKIDTQGGPPIDLADAPNALGGSWSVNGTIVFAPNAMPSNLRKVSSSGGSATPATETNAEVGSGHRLPWFLPDGTHFLFASMKRASRTKLVVGSIDSTASKVVGEADSNAIYTEGRLLFLQDGTLMARHFDVKALRMAGEAVPLAEGVESFFTNTVGIFSASATGLLAYQTGDDARVTQLTWFDRMGEAVGTVWDPREFLNIELSPDGKTLAATARDNAGNVDLWTYDLERNLPRRLTFDPAAEVSAIWSPDGHSLVFSSDRKGHADLYRKAADGSGAEELLYADEQDKDPGSWSADGKLLYHGVVTGARSKLFLLPLTPGRSGASVKPVRFLQTDFTEVWSKFSPDGSWVAYTSDESPKLEVYAVPVSRPAEKHQISANGGVMPRWRRDGKEIFYTTPAGQLLVAEVQIDRDKLEVGAIRPLFRGIRMAYFYLYDVSSDGQRILAAVPSRRQRAPDPITLVQNWAAPLTK